MKGPLGLNSSAMSSSFDTMRKAQEDKFFKQEQERNIMKYLERLRKEGRLTQVMETPSTALSRDALPQVLAHQLRLAAPKEKQDTRVVDRAFMTRHTIKGTCTGNPMYIGATTMGNRISLGRGKWEAGMNTVSGTTIFSVQDASRLMQGPTIDSVAPRVSKHLVDNSFVEVRGVKLKLMPDPTPGRAMAWGGTLALWGTAGLVMFTCRALGITSMEDLSIVMKNKLTPFAEGLKSQMEPLAMKVKTMDGSTDRSHIQRSKLTKDIRNMLSASGPTSNLI